MRGAVEVMKHMTDEGDMEDTKKLELLEEELKEKEEEQEYLVSLSQNLIIKERNTNDELQEARKELINVIFHFFYLQTPSLSSYPSCVLFLLLYIV